MKIDLSKLFDAADQAIPFACRLDLSHVRRWGTQVFAEPVGVTGQAVNRSGVVSVSYTADFVLDTVCDRCLAKVYRPLRISFSHTVVLSLNREDNDEFIVIPDGQLDLAELATADILLELPTSIVCKEDCKGLCPLCGTNLNGGDCGCDRQTRDPRLDKLRELLEK